MQCVANEVGCVGHNNARSGCLRRQLAVRWTKVNTGMIEAEREGKGTPEI